jgi:hypothetical protein
MMMKSNVCIDRFLFVRRNRRPVSAARRLRESPHFAAARPAPRRCMASAWSGKPRGAHKPALPPSRRRVTRPTADVFVSEQWCTDGRFDGANTCRHPPPRLSQRL